MKRSVDNRSTPFFFRSWGRRLLVLLPGILFFSSCGTASMGTAKAEPPAWGELGDFPPESPGESSREGPVDVSGPEPAVEALEPEEPEAFDDDPVEAAAPAVDVFRNPEEDQEYLEAPFNFAETFEGPPSPPEPPLAVFPEPPAPVFPEPELEPEPPVETAGPQTPVPEIVEAPPLDAPPPVPPGPSPPALPPAVPPPYIRPAEEYAAPPAQAPVPQPRIPDPPARTPPVEILEPETAYSRTVRATVGQLVEVPFRGTGWVYLGELGSRPGIVYASRRLDPEGQSFIFRTEAPGTYGLKFYKQDFIRDYILNDHVQVIVGEPPEAAALGWFNPAIDRGRVAAEPRWPNALEEEALGRNSGAGTQAVRAGTGRAQRAAEVQGGTDRTSGAVIGTQGAAEVQGPAVQENVPPPASDGVLLPAAAVQGPVDAGRPDRNAGEDGGPEDLRPGDYPERARREFEAGRVASAIAVLDQFRERYPSGSDEVWWLYGQFYEAGSPFRDIRSALDYYRRLVREYPQSRRYNDARRRIAYLERYYINIR